MHIVAISFPGIFAMFSRLFCGLLLALCIFPAAASASDPSPYLNAELRHIGGSTYLRGTTRTIDSIIRKCAQSVPGCPTSFPRSSLYFRLPLGIHYQSHYTYAPLFPVTCSVTAMPDDSEHLACTGGGLSTGIYTVGQLVLTVAIANDAPLGPGRIVLGVDDSLPAESGTLAECIGDSFPNYCAELTGTIDVAPAPDLYIDRVNHNPLVFQPDDMSSRVRVSIGNRGNAPTTGTHLQAHLPPGFQWQLATTTTGGFSMTCSKTGSWDTAGETVTCSGGALAANVYFEVALGIRPRDNMEVPGPLPVLASVNDGASASAAVLMACASDSSPAHCAWHEVATWIACARNRDSGIFCDSFDVQVPAGLQVSDVDLND